MMDDELTSLSLVTAARLIREGELSPLELTQACLAKIERLDGRLNSFITLTADAALQCAWQAQEEARKGETLDGSPLGPLHGIPIVLKDLFETKGLRTTAGSKVFGDYIPETDAVVVEKLRAAGAIFLGKTNMHEIALGLTNVNPHYGACRNPWAEECISGGSSGGSAVALAAGFCQGALGSDTGGSVRVPSALCGVVGLKPTYGRVSLRGVIPLSWNLDHVGPMARQVEDVALLLHVIAGYDPDDPYSVNVEVADYMGHIQEGVEGWHIALMEDDYLKLTDPQVKQAVIEAAGIFEKLGACVVPTGFPNAYQAALANGLMVTSDAAVFHQERMQNKPHQFGADVWQRLQNGASLSLKDYIEARRTQSFLRRQYERFFERFDLLLIPTTPVTAFPIEGSNAVEMARLLTRYTSPFNLTGLPALSLPCGFNSDGLPIGLQIVAKRWSEAWVLRGGYAYQQATDWRLRNPPL
jgi:aspartyl-tRNA(Asn)/glutamyl-tRNA(Gln) amidotransferase subunit A